MVVAELGLGVPSIEAISIRYFFVVKAQYVSGIPDAEFENLLVGYGRVASPRRPDE